MKNVTQSETDTFDEVNNVLNNIINEVRGIGLNQQLIESKVEILDEAIAIEPKKKGKKSIRTSIVPLFILAMLLITSTAFGYVTTDINFDIVTNPDQLVQYLRDSFGNVTSDSFLFTPRATPPAGGLAVEGRVYYDSVSNTLQLHTGSGFTPIDTAGGVSLDSAYDFGSAGGGRAIVSNDGAVTISKTDTGTENVLEISASPSGGADGDGILVTLGTNSTGVGIQFALGGGATNDLAGTSDSWTISKAGAFAGVGGTWTGDHLFTGSSKNIEVDVSQDAMHFLDDAKLAIGGATTAAGDFVFSYDGTDLNLEAAAANDDYRMGETTHFNLVIHGETNTNEVTFDTDNSALVAIWDGFKIRLNDNDLLLFGDSSEFTIDYDEASTDNLIIVALNANDAVQVGDGTTGTDFKAMAATSGDFLLFDASADELFFEDVDLKINEGAQIEFSVADNSIDWTIDVSTDEVLLFLPTEITDDQSFNIGNATNTSDVRIFGATASTVVFDATADEVLFNAYDISMGDGDIIRYGDGDDLVMSATGTTITSTIAAGSAWNISDTDNASSKLTLGVVGGTHGLDVQFNTVSSGEDMIFDAAAKTFTLDNVDVVMGDADSIAFGDGADLTVSATTTTTTMTMAAGSSLKILDTDDAASLVTFGLTGGTHGLDVTYLTITPGDFIKFDAAAKTLTFTDTELIMDGPAQMRDAMDETGTKFDLGTPVTIIFNPTIGETLSYTVPAGVDLLVLDAWGWKTAAGGVGAGDQWDLKNNNTNSIFTVLELAGVSDTDRVEFDGLIDTEYELEAGETLDLIAGEDTDDDGADGIIIVTGMFKVAD